MSQNPLLAPAKEMLATRGFKKKGRSGLFVKELNQGINAWLGLNTGRRHGALALTPTVGVRHELVAHWVALLLELDPKNWTAPTVSTGMNLLVRTDRVPPWILVNGDEAQNAQVWKTLGEELDEFVMPWMLERDTSEKLIEPLRRREGAETSRLSLPVLHWVLGDQLSARQALEEGRHWESNSGMVIDYDAFAARLGREIDAHPGGPRQ